MSTVAKFKFRYTQVLDAAGRPVAELPGFAQDPGTLIGLYRAMVLTRRFDAKAVSLQRTGRMGTYASSLGQEAVGVGAATAMRAEDVFLPSYREAGGQFCRGVRLEEVLLYWGGDERGSDFQGPREDFPVCVPVGSHSLHTTGVAYAFRLRRQPRVALAIMGDGATSRGDFYEAINMAGAWHVPAVFVIANNQWAISVPRARQSAAPTLAQKAVAAGFHGEQVDGNDVIAVRQVVGEALERARSGEGPHLIEALTYRLTDHTTADDAGRYRSVDEVSEHWRDDPLARLRSYLAEQGHWSKQQEEGLLEEVDAEIQAAVDAYLASEPQPPEAMFDYLFAELPEALAEQREKVIAEAGRRERNGGDA